MIIAKENKYESEKLLKILNFYSDGCHHCHTFMPIFFDAEKTFGDYFDFIVINTGENMELSKKFNIMGTPTIIIIKDKEIVFNQSGIPNGANLKEFMLQLSGF